MHTCVNATSSLIFKTDVSISMHTSINTSTSKSTSTHTSTSTITSTTAKQNTSTSTRTGTNASTSSSKLLVMRHIPLVISSTVSVRLTIQGVRVVLLTLLMCVISVNTGILEFRIREV